MAKSKRRKRKHWPIPDGLVVRARVFSQKELVAIRRIIRQHPKWGRTKLSEVVSELLSWRQSNGRLKDRACRVALVRLESLGFLKLPAKLVPNGGKPPSIRAPVPTNASRIVTTMPASIRCEKVQNASDARVWNALISHFHYLGLATPVGRLLRYLIYGDGQLLGAISFGESAWNIKLRDSLLHSVGIDSTERRLAVIGNNRFLILPNVRVPNLASRVLAESLRILREDWAEQYSAKPLIVETFVDPRRFEGTCYRAANWLLAGKTKGFSKCGACHAYADAPKLLFLKGLTPLMHRLLAQSITELQKRAA